MATHIDVGNTKIKTLCTHVRQIDNFAFIAQDDIQNAQTLDDLAELLRGIDCKFCKTKAMQIHQRFANPEPYDSHGTHYHR